MEGFVMRGAMPFLFAAVVTLAVAWSTPAYAATEPFVGTATGTYPAGSQPDLLDVQGSIDTLGSFDASSDVIRGGDPSVVSGVFSLHFSGNNVLQGTYDGWFEIPEPFEGVILVGGYMTFTGGSGQYKDASGGAEIQGQVEFGGGPSVLTLSFDGTVITKKPGASLAKRAKQRPSPGRGRW